MTSKLAVGIRAAADEEIRRVGPDTVERLYRFPADFSGFAGHFPGFPILPAVVQIQTAHALAEDHLQAPLRLAAVESAKFLLQLPPAVEIAVECRLRRREGRLLCDARLRRGGELAATFTLELAEGEAG